MLSEFIAMAVDILRLGQDVAKERGDVCEPRDLEELRAELNALDKFVLYPGPQDDGDVAQ